MVVFEADLKTNLIPLLQEGMNRKVVVLLFDVVEVASFLPRIFYFSKKPHVNSQ